jgi:transcriptional regulator with XRE-family HTH domain
MQPVKHYLGNELRALRGERSIYQVAKEIGIDKTQLARYEKGRLPTDEILEKLAGFYGVSYQSLKGLCLDELFPKGSAVRNAVLHWASDILSNRPL